jgi:hypothetical protein
MTMLAAFGNLIHQSKATIVKPSPTNATISHIPQSIVHHHHHHHHHLLLLLPKKPKKKNLQLALHTTPARDALKLHQKK